MATQVIHLCLSAELRILMGVQPAADAVGTWSEGTQRIAAILVASETATRATTILIWWATYV